MAIDIQALINAGESETVEWKQSTGEIQEILETAGAFANTTGGTLIIGVARTGGISGVTLGKNTLEALANSIQQQTDPKVFPVISTTEIDGKTVIGLQVSASPIKPVLVQGRGFKRIGRSNHMLSSSELTRLFFESWEVSWDAGPIAETTSADLQEESIRRFLRQAQRERNMIINVDAPLNEVLEKLELLYQKQLSRAAVLLFGKRPQKFLLSSEIRCARFKGTEPLHFIDMKVIEGNIIDQVLAAMEFIQRHISMAAEIVPTQLERLERWEYPLDALREAIINAACHRDYQDRGHIQIRIFDDRLEVWSPGLLPPEIALADLSRPHNSRPRNHRIARAFFLNGYIEHWGTGTLRMIQLCKAAGVPEPEFAEISGCFVVIFRKSKLTKKYHKGKVSIDRQEQVVEYLRQMGKITTPSYAELFDVSKRTASRDLAVLVEKGVLRQVGKARAGYFELV
jgi:ATP-dependent DNA helicase RecG